MKNFMEVKFKALSVNEGFARVCVASFCLQLNPTVDQLSDIKTAVSEAVTNCVVHAYPKTKPGDITLRCEIDGGDITIKISDEGVGIKDINQARQPFFTTRAGDERSGMGFTVMEGFMDKVEVCKNQGKGTTVTLTKRIEQEKQVVGG